MTNLSYYTYVDRDVVGLELGLMTDDANAGAQVEHAADPVVLPYNFVLGLFLLSQYFTIHILSPRALV